MKRLEGAMSGSILKRVPFQKILAVLLLIPVAVLLLYKTPPDSLFAQDSAHWVSSATLARPFSILNSSKSEDTADLLTQAAALVEEMKWQGRLLREQLSAQETKRLSELSQQLDGVQTQVATLTNGRSQGASSAGYPPTFTRCHHGDWDGLRLEPFPEVEWAPRKGKYMIAACYDGGYSNRMLCITYLAQVAAMLGRIMVLLPWPGMILPHQGGDEWITFDLASVIDVEFMSSCVAGGNAALSWDEFQASHKGVVKAEGICFEAQVSDPSKYLQPCGFAIEHGLDAFNLSITMKGWVNLTKNIEEEDLLHSLKQAGDPDILWVLGTHNNIPYVSTPEGGRRPSWPHTPVVRT
jgi:hypothetical protein